MANNALARLIEHPPFPTIKQPALVSVVFDGESNARLSDELPNVIIRSSDAVYFAVHSKQILSTSTNQFSGLLPLGSQYTVSNPAKVALPEPSDVLNDLFHTVYGLSCDLHWPALESIHATMEALKKYGITPLEVFVFRDTFLYHAILHEATQHPLEAFVCAAQYKLEDVAVATSAKTLHHRVYDLDLETGAKMGTFYLSRLYRLHCLRTEHLKHLFYVRLPGHVPTASCSLAHQRHVYVDLQLICKKLFVLEPELYLVDFEKEFDEYRPQVDCPECSVMVCAEMDRIIDGFKKLETTI